MLPQSTRYSVLWEKEPHMEAKTCTNCGMDLEIASQPTEKLGKPYCCDGCANDTGCTC